MIEDKIAMAVIGGLSVIAIIGSTVNSIVNNSIKKKADQHNILWDAYNSTKHDSSKIESLQSEFKKIDIFIALQTASNALVTKQLDELGVLIRHKENGNSTNTSSLFAVLERIEDKLDEKKS